MALVAGASWCLSRLRMSGDSKHGQSTPLDDNKKPEFVADMARFAEGIVTEQAVKKKYRFDNATWEKLGDDDGLVELIEAEKVQRIRSGDSARERAQIHFAAAPNVLGDILNDQHASPRYRIESARELRVVIVTRTGWHAPAGVLPG
jgi:hypothetical protein